MRNARLSEPNHGEYVDYDTGAVIYYAGHQPYGIYRFVQGEIRLVGRRNSRNAAIGEILGLKACLAGKPHEETARCTAPTRVYFTSRREF